MAIVLFDVLCGLVVAAGLALAFRGAGPPDKPGVSPAVYARRIAGVMLAAFAFAIATMVTAFYLA